MSESEAIVRIFISLVLGAIIGLEREFSQQFAGLRTHILVCLGSTVFTLLSISTMNIHLSSQLAQGGQIVVSRDPGRIAAQIVSGIGFIGGGAVLRHGTSVRGITTAASLWMVASIGMLAGFGYYKISLIATLVAFLVLFTIGHIERSYFQKHLKTFNRLRIGLTVNIANQAEAQDWIDKKFGKEVLQLKTVTHPSPELLEGEDGTIQFTYVIEVKSVQLNLTELSRQLNALAGMQSASVKIYLDETPL